MPPEPLDYADIEFRLTPEYMRQALARAAALLAIDRILYAQTATAWAGFRDRDFPVLDPPPPPPLGSVDPALDDAVVELNKADALDQKDMILIEAIRERAVVVSQRLPDLLLGGESVGTELFADAAAVSRKLELFWARIRIDSDEAYDGREIEDAETGATMSDLVKKLIEAAAMV